MTAPARDRTAPSDLREQLRVETPEHVELQLELAGVGSRAAAALLDTALILGCMLLIALVASALGQSDAMAERWALAILILVYVFGFFGYFALFEALTGGRTPGKRALGIRVVMDSGHAITPVAAVVRNLVRLMDCFLPFFPILPGFLMVLLHRRHQRPGDLAAGTIVVRDRPMDWSLGPGPATAPEPLEAGPPELSDAEFRLLDQFLARQEELDPAMQVRMATDLAARFQERVPRRAADADVYLAALHSEEQRRRRGRFATRAQAGAIGRTTVTAERFVAQKREAWDAFRSVATRVERSGVGALPPGDIPAFATRYREVASDLARARTYRVDPRVIEYLERLVSAGHNALYRSRGRRRTPLGRYVLRDFPAAVVLSWRYVGAAFLLFTVPAFAGYGIVRSEPGRAEELVSPVLVSRAAEAAEREARGIGYAESQKEDLPIIASAIISNNVMIAFWAFAGGILLGLPAIFVLVKNGLALGMGFGVFVNYHAGGYLATFVAGHGILELTGIFIAGGAGLRMAGALFAPGDRTRRDALVVEGRIATQMIGSVITLLAIAGTIEGLLSASDAPAVYKYATGALSIVFLGIYFVSGWAHLERETPATGLPQAP
ncbi:MAG TPA: stage II sporulation protein M [Gemmatimonadales bacterium]|nr:stage II sporulation protein M [Gemmatimonadales bacterium]